MTRRDWRNSTPTATYRAVVGLAFAALGCSAGLAAASSVMLMVFHAARADFLVWIWLFATPVMFLFLLWYLQRQYYLVMLLHLPPSLPDAPKDRIVPVVVNRGSSGVGGSDALDY